MPVYNGADTIRRSIQSVRNQIYTEWELLIIDNGSKDGTLDIAQTYEEADPRIKVLYCRQAGVINARKEGLKQAKGEYIAFLDADDQMRPNMLQSIYNILKRKEYDIISCGYDIVDNGEIIETCKAQISGEVTSNLFFHNLFETGTLGFLWNKIYRSDIIRSAIHPNEIDVCEDLYANCSMLLHSLTIYVLPDCLYMYFINRSSVTRTMEKKITYDGEWKYYLAYVAIEEMCKDNSQKKKCVEKAKWNIIKLGIEELLKEKSFFLVKHKLLLHMKRCMLKVWFSDCTLRFKLGYLKTYLQGIFWR